MSNETNSDDIAPSAGPCRGILDFVEFVEEKSYRNDIDRHVMVYGIVGRYERIVLLAARDLWGLAACAGAIRSDLERYAASGAAQPQEGKISMVRKEKEEGRNFGDPGSRSTQHDQVPLCTTGAVRP